MTSALWIVAVAAGLWPPSAGERNGAQPFTFAAFPGARAPASAPSAWRIPVAGIAADDLRDSFGDERGGGLRTHHALDIAAPHGTPVVAAADGDVEKLFVSDDGGLTIYIRSPDRRLLSYYAHLGAYAAGLREGARVRQGAVLGTVGSSGNASAEAPHLHFALYRMNPDDAWHQTGAPINPYPLLTRSEPIAAADRRPRGGDR
ncbi:M23 family metallopeptidase [Erythrobacteraceae bacterium CFH 75059]|nr:M23 family metallopeptidase [Erythrobacteraceae bacterium CFH 75059]